MAEPTTAKNLYKLTMTVGDVPGDPLPCGYDSGTYEGYAAVVIERDFNSGQLARKLWLAGFSATGDIYWDVLTKQ